MYNKLLESFHSFEVGFGLDLQNETHIVTIRFSFLRGRLRTSVSAFFHGSRKIAFSFLRGRLRTENTAIHCEILRRFSFLRGRLRTKSKVVRFGGEYFCFHSFEVGFGRAHVQTGGVMMYRGFHSFEVGFGQVFLLSLFSYSYCFHSFEVGFGPQVTGGRLPEGCSFHSFEVGFGREYVCR